MQNHCVVDDQGRYIRAATKILTVALGPNGVIEDIQEKDLPLS